MRRLLLAVWALLLAVHGAGAHEVRPAYLEIRQTGAESYQALWKVPGQGDTLRLGCYVVLPPACTTTSPPRAEMVNNAFIERWEFSCPGGLSGGAVRIAGLESTMIDVLVRVERIDAPTQVARLTPSHPSFVVGRSPALVEVAETYLWLGVEHILGGVDHLLFVLALVLLINGRARMLLRTITAFTLAHSLTLALAVLGVVRIPAAPVEAVIALSIVFVAAELVDARTGAPGLGARSPWTVAFAFGLLHGFGFAGALSEVGLPPNAIPAALLMFNIGVEVGQLLFVGAVLLAAASLRRVRLAGRARGGILPAYAIGGWAAYWFVQRLSMF